MNKNYTKNLEVALEVEIKKRGILTKITYEAVMSTDNLSFKEIAGFQKDLARINHCIKVFTDKSMPFKMAVTVSETDWTDWEKLKTCRTISFNLWEFDGYNDIPEREEEMGVHLNPNTKYTPEHRDAWYDFTLESLPDGG